MNSAWGNYPKVRQRPQPLMWRTDDLPTSRPLLPYGMGRSYGDVALNDRGIVITTQYLNHIISFDAAAGLIRCEAGVTIGDILEIVVPHGWFVPVSPGTKFVSVGGAIANDVHGKNHHRAGTLGCHVTQFELLRTDKRVVCSPEENRDLFQATIGGLGLTGVITWAEIQLTKIPSAHVDMESIKFESLDEFMQLSEKSDTTHEYTVAWLDTSRKNTRGIFMRANWTPMQKHSSEKLVRKPIAELPLFMPGWLVSTPLIKTFNIGYYYKQLAKRSHATVHYDPFFYPLDILQYWNRLYGKRGFQSFQCVVPNENGKGKTVIARMLHEIHSAGLASPLTVLKLFGDKQSPGMLSFPRPGINLLLDFPNVGQKLDELLASLDTITLEAGGRVNPSKDAHLSPQAFQYMYPNWRQFQQHIDPAFSSSFWRRVTKKP